jgi:hypothetical protein
MMHNGTRQDWQNPPHWHDNFQRVQEACRRSGGTHDAADVLRQLNEDNTTFWQASPTSFFIGEVITYPRKRVFRCWLAGGQRDEVLYFGEHYKPLARAAGCREVELWGRPGWERVFPTWRKTAVVLRTDDLGS